MSRRPRVGVVLGSTRDLEAMEPCFQELRRLEIGHEVRVLSAHRTPEEVVAYALEAAERGLAVLVAAAGMAAHLPGVLASRTDLPVIGVPLPSPLGGLEALYAIVQMPRGVPVGAVAVGTAGPANAALLAARILSLGDPDLRQRLRRRREEMRAAVLAEDERVRRERSWMP